jgi:hypothetical protein
MGGFGSGYIEKPEIKLFRKIEKIKSGCWIFSNYKSVKYCSFNFHGRVIGAHRASYLMFKGKIPRGKLVMHLCDNPKCVNPDHLKLGTPKDNTRDMIQKERASWIKAKRKCVRGHSIDGLHRCQICKRAKLWRGLHHAKAHAK